MYTNFKDSKYKDLIEKYINIFYTVCICVYLCPNNLATFQENQDE